MSQSDGSITVTQLMSGKPIPIEAFQSAVPKLTLVQRIALRVVAGRLAAARAELAQVMTECGLDPEANYAIAADGSIRLHGNE